MPEYICKADIEQRAIKMCGFGENKYVPLSAIEHIPAADVAPVVHGRWKCHKYIEEYQCEICGHFVRFGTVKNYCPNCGAKMDGEENK